MLAIFNITILVLIMIALLFFILKSFNQWKTTNERESYQRLLDNQSILSREVIELKRAMDHQKNLAQQEFDQLRKDIKSLTVKIQAPFDEQNLLLNDRYMEIFELQKKGLSTEQIATKLDRGLGEVEFILQLATQSSH